MKLTMKEAFDLSIERWGIRSQHLMVAEEAGELSVASLHLNRANKGWDECFENFAEEIADVEFMLDEMKYYYTNVLDLHLVSKIASYRKIKMERLDKLLRGRNKG